MCMFTTYSSGKAVWGFTWLQEKLPTIIPVKQMKILFQLSRGNGVWSCFKKKCPEVFEGAQDASWRCFLYSKWFHCINKEYVPSGLPVWCLEKHRSPSSYFRRAWCDVWRLKRCMKIQIVWPVHNYNHLAVGFAIKRLSQEVKKQHSFRPKQTTNYTTHPPWCKKIRSSCKTT